MHPALRYDLTQARRRTCCDPQPTSAWPRTPGQRACRAVTTRRLRHGSACCIWYGACSPHERLCRRRRCACQPECAFLGHRKGSQ
jgi:hypothetical protein